MVSHDDISRITHQFFTTNLLLKLLFRFLANNSPIRSFATSDVNGWSVNRAEHEKSTKSCKLSKCLTLTKKKDAFSKYR